MGGFEFGVITSTAAVTGTETFIAVVILLVAFECLLIGVDMLRENFPSAYLMFQKIFKELMIMGILSFSVVMFETSKTFTNEEILISTDSAHILLFFMALFYVLHAIFLVNFCRITALKNRRFHNVPIESVLSKMYEKKSSLENFLFHSRIFSFFPVSRREMVEFKIYDVFFKKTYNLSDNFAFADYLNGCDQKRCVQLLDVGISTWVIIIILALLNILRVEIRKMVGGICA